MINVQKKGKRAELAVAKIINRVLGTNVRRTPNSGGLSIKGDIIDISHDSPIYGYHFEIKDRKTISLKAWWRQTISDCPATKSPILIFKFEHKFYVMQGLDDWLGDKIPE